MIEKDWLHEFNYRNELKKPRSEGDSFKEIDDNDGNIIYWRNNKDEYHRKNGPAIIFPDGYQAWYLNGRRHRKNGPAVISPDGYQVWYQNNKRHRENGPAVIDRDGPQAWCLNDINLIDEDIIELKDKHPLLYNYWLVYKTMKE